VKWFLMVVVTVLLVPITARAEPPVIVILEKWHRSIPHKKMADVSTFGIVAKDEDLHSVRGTVRLYLTADAVIDELPKVRCGIYHNDNQEPDRSENLIAGSYGPELWFPHIPKGKRRELVIFGKTFPPELYGATFEVTSDEGDKAYTWTREQRPSGQLGLKPIVGYREVTLNEICEEFLSEKAKG